MERQQGSRRGPMRSVLITIMALGLVVTFAGVNGVFAIFTDRATTGTNTASSRAEPRSADIQLAIGDLVSGPEGNVVECGAYSDHLATPLITLTDAAPETGARGFVCVKNVGSRTVEVDSLAIDLVDIDTDCTGDEGALDTATCGSDLQGELSRQLEVNIFDHDCAAPAGSSVGTQSLQSMTTTPVAFSTIAPSAARCGEYIVRSVPVGDQLTVGQSDTSTWKFAFDATAV